MLRKTNPLRADTTFAILSGGYSSRMEQDKSLLPIYGKPLIERILERGRLITNELIVITNRLTDYEFLNVPLFPDSLSMKGPLVGLYSALYNTRTKYLVLVGCDMPLINPKLLSYELLVMDQGGYDIVIPEHADLIEPLHAVYHREGCLAAVKSALESGERSLSRWHGRVTVCRVGESVLRRFDPGLICFTNLNTPQEYQSLIQSMDLDDTF